MADRPQRKRSGGKQKSTTSKPRSYWLLVTTLENFRITREQDFTVQGVRSRERKKALRMIPGDRLLYYIIDEMRFPATATVTSEQFEDRSPLWNDTSQEEVFPHRVHIQPDVVLDDPDWLDAREIGPRMEYVKRWIPERWYLAFYQGQLHLIPQRDFTFIEDEMSKLVRRQAPHSRH